MAGQAHSGTPGLRFAVGHKCTSHLGFGLERKELHRRVAKERRERAKALGLCRDCFKEAIIGQTKCEICSEKHRQRRRKYDAGRRAKAKAGPELNRKQAV